MQLKSIFYRYEVLLTVIALLIIGSLSNISKTVSIESSIQYPDDKSYPVALTFDDGPYPGFTEKLLTILNNFNIKATFFVIGRHAKEHPELIKLIDSCGHEMGGHTYSHANITKLSNKKLLFEIEETQKCIEEITGKQTFLFRPPGGKYSKRTMRFISHLGYTTVLWSLLPKDLEKKITKDNMLNYVQEEIKPNGIILLHTGSKETLEALPEIISYLRSKGYRFVTVSELLNKNLQSVKQYII